MHSATDTGKPWDTLIRGAWIFDGSGAEPKIGDLAIAAGRVARVGTELPAERAGEVVAADGLWLMPGLLDIHTHLDLEVELNPGLGEAVRHGTTTVVVGNCSLGTAFGAQNKKGDNPIVDCFARVENMPKDVLQKCVDRMDWDNTADYLEHFKQLPLGPNIAALIPHSMLRVEVMGVDDSVSRSPTAAECKAMCGLLEQAMQQGYIGLSTDQIVFHYLSMDPNKNRRLPTQFADDTELRGMIDILRRHDRVWQTNPDSDRMGRTLKRLFWTSGRLYGKPLRTSVLTALDFDPAPGTWKHILRLSRLLNSRLLRGRIHFQALGTNFRIWSDGVVAPFFEELESTRELVSCELDDRQARLELLNDPEWQQRFERDWEVIFVDENLPRRRRRMGSATFQLEFSRMFFADCAVSDWDGDSLAAVYGRLLAWQRSSGAEGAKSEAEAEIFARFARGIDSEMQFFLDGLRLFDLQFRWWQDVANRDSAIVERILFDPGALPGFNDSGAHLTNMAFYDANLMTLKIAAAGGLQRVAQAVRRLTREPAEFFDLDVGGMEVGAQADLLLIDPQRLAEHDTNARRQKIMHEIFGREMMVNRSDGVVWQVYIRGRRVWEDGCKYTPVLGSETLGRALTSASAASLSAVA